MFRLKTKQTVVYKVIVIKFFVCIRILKINNKCLHNSAIKGGNMYSTGNNEEEMYWLY